MYAQIVLTLATAETSVVQSSGNTYDVLAHAVEADNTVEMLALALMPCCSNLMSYCLLAAGPAMVQMNQRIVRSIEEKQQLEHAVVAQAKRMRSVQAELAAANSRSKQLEVCLQELLPVA